MARSAAIALVSLFAVTLASCSTTWQSTRQPKAMSYVNAADHVERTVGRLRRLLILPTGFHTSHCGSMSDTAEGDALDNSIITLLTQWKGYDVVQAKAEDRLELVNLSEALGKWQDKHSGTEPLENTTAGRLSILASDYTIDGVVVVHTDIQCLSVGEIVSYFAIIGMPHFWRKLTRENVSAGIYDAGAAGLIWLHRINYGSEQGYTRLPDELFAPWRMPFPQCSQSEALAFRETVIISPWHPHKFHLG